MTVCLFISANVLLCFKQKLPERRQTYLKPSIFGGTQVPIKIFLYNTQQSNVSPAPQSTNNRPLQNFFILQYQQCLIGLCSFGPVSSKQGSNTKKLFQTRMKACLTRLAHFNLGFAVFWPILSFYVFGVVFLKFYLFSQTISSFTCYINRHHCHYHCHYLPVDGEYRHGRQVDFI